MSPQMAAFIASERSRPQQEAPRPIESGVSQVAHDFQKQQQQDLRKSGDGWAKGAQRKSMVMAYVLWWFCSPLGAHRFYLGANQSGAAMAGLFFGGLLLGIATGSGYPVTLIGVWFVWTLADVFLIPGLTRRANGPSPAFAFA